MSKTFRSTDINYTNEYMNNCTNSSFASRQTRREETAMPPKEEKTAVPVLRQRRPSGRKAPTNALKYANIQPIMTTNRCW